MKSFFLFITALLTVSLTYTCNQNPNKIEVEDSLAINTPSQLDLDKGFDLVESYCFTCHSVNAGKEDRIAPPMAAVKKHYYTDGMSEAQFIKDITTFLNNPSEDISKMPGAIEKFNLMPKMNFNEEDVKLIAQYIFHTELQKPNWHKNEYEQQKKHKKQHGKQKGKQEDGEINYVAQGKEYALKTKSILGKNLLSAINEKGTAEAVSFCNIEAISLTNTFANEGEVSIKRVSDLERNPNNKANEEELAYIKAAKEQLAEGKELKPKLTELESKAIGYYPIMTNAMCLQCHGKANEIDETTLAKLNNLYPNDKAKGYAADELRGIWVVEMNK